MSGVDSLIILATLNNSTASSSSSSSNRLLDFTNVFLLPPICLLGAILNALCIWVVANLPGELYAFIMCHSICDLAFLFINMFTCVIRCGAYCPYGDAYVSKIWELYVHLYVGNTFLLFGIGLDIV